MPHRILVIDDEAAQSAVIRAVAEQMGHEVTTAVDPRKAVELYQDGKPDLIVLDIVMPEMDGFEVLKALATAGCKARILMISGYNPRYLSNAETFGEFYGIEVTSVGKPLSVPTIRDCLRRLLPASEPKS